MELKRIAIDTSKSVFTLHGVDAARASGAAPRPAAGANWSLLRQAGAERGGAGSVRRLAPLGAYAERLGHRVGLIPPQYVKPFVKRGKTDRNDAEAISEAASRPRAVHGAGWRSSRLPNKPMLSL